MSKLDDLKAELAAGHPETGPYDSDPKIAADQMNARNITRIRKRMTGAEILEAINGSEFDLLNDDQVTQILTFLSGNNNINPVNGGIAQKVLERVFGQGSATMITLNILRQETVSQATVLGFGKMRGGYIEYARAN